MADNRALRNHQWTLAEVDGSGWELFRRNEDLFESKNIANNHPDIVSKLNATWLRWWKAQSGQAGYTTRSTADKKSYKSQGDRGSGVPYIPSAMPDRLSTRYPIRVSR